MLLIHTSRVVHVGVDFSHVVKVTVWYLFGVCGFLILVQEDIEVVFSLQILQTAECKAL